MNVLLTNKRSRFIFYPSLFTILLLTGMSLFILGDFFVKIVTIVDLLLILILYRKVKRVDKYNFIINKLNNMFSDCRVEQYEDNRLLSYKVKMIIFADNKRYSIETDKKGNISHKEDITSEIIEKDSIQLKTWGFFRFTISTIIMAIGVYKFIEYYDLFVGASETKVVMYFSFAMTYLMLMIIVLIFTLPAINKIKLKKSLIKSLGNDFKIKKVSDDPLFLCHYHLYVVDNNELKEIRMRNGRVTSQNTLLHIEKDH